jgi:hypothetical protein
MCDVIYEHTFKAAIKQQQDFFCFGLNLIFCLSFWWENENQFRLDARHKKGKREERIRGGRVWKSIKVGPNYCKDRLKNLVFLSLSVCTKRSTLFGQGNSTQAVFKGTPS